MRDTIGGKRPIERVQTHTPWSSSPLVSRAAQFMQTPWKQSSVRKAGERGERITQQWNQGVRTSLQS